MKNIIVLTLLIFAVTVANAQESKKKSKKEKRAEREAMRIEQTKTVLENKAYLFVATQALPSGARSVNLTSSYDAKIENDTIICYLPFYGRAHTASFGGGDSPMDFTQPIENYNFEKTKKGYQIKFDVKNKTDRLNFTLQIAESGSTSLNVTSSNRSSMSYYGDIEKIEEEK